MKIKVWWRKRDGKLQWFVSHRKEILSGPWATVEEARQAKQEWMF